MLVGRLGVYIYIYIYYIYNELLGDGACFVKSNKTRGRLRTSRPTRPPGASSHAEVAVGSGDVSVLYTWEARDTPMDMRIPPLEIEILLESNPLKSIFCVWRFTVSDRRTML